MRVGIIGCGVIGPAKSSVIHESEYDEVAMVADVDGRRGEEAGQRRRVCLDDSLGGHRRDDDLDVVVVATTNQWLSQISLAALEGGKHVLCEKPAGRSPGEVQA